MAVGEGEEEVVGPPVLPVIETAGTEVVLAPNEVGELVGELVKDTGEDVAEEDVFCPYWFIVEFVTLK